MSKVIDAMFLNGDSTDIDMQALVAAVDDIVFVVNAKSVFLNAWARDERMLFMPKEEFLNKPIYEVMGPLAPLFEGLIDKVVKTGEIQEVNYKHIDAEIDEHFRVRANLYKYNEDGAKCKIAITVRDITEQVKQQQALEEARKKAIYTNSVLLDCQSLSKTGGWDYNLATGAVSWTDQTYEIFDRPIGETIAYENIFALYQNLDKTALDKRVENCINNRTEYDVVLKAKNGKDIRVIGMPVVENDEVVGIRGVVMDITEKLTLEKQLVQAKEVAEKAATAKTDFLSIMSHEIRTPLNGIIGIANLLGQNKNAAHGGELIDSLIFSSNHLLKLVNDILDLNKIESDKLELNTETVDLKQLLKSINTQFGGVAKDKGLKLTINVDEQLPQYITADAVRIGQMLNNLVGNALKFTEQGGVTTTVKQLSQEDNKVTIHFSIKDTGIGIPADQIDAVFESFNQVKQDNASNNVGTGLGLTITKRLVALHNGEIQIKSTVGEGTEFFFDLIFDLPTATTENKKAIDRADVAAYKGHFAHLKVMLVEDNPVNVLVARKQLEHFGITPICVTNGKQALDLLQQHYYDLVLTDIHMPEMDGFELSAHIRKSYPRVHIVGFTADITPEAKEQMAQLGIYDILSKPFAPKQMLNILLKASELKELNLYLTTWSEVVV